MVGDGCGAHKRDLNNLYQVIYYGDSQVEVGKPFSISCIISIANPVEWHKDGEPIRKHSNIRHGKDEHSYIESEMGIAGTGSSRNAEKHHDDMQLMLSTVKSTLVAPLSVEHHHFTTAVALAPGPAIIDEEFPGGSLERELERERESSKSSAHSPHHHRQQAAVGHRHHTGSSTEKKPQQHASSSPSKEDSKRFVSQKTTIDQDSRLPEEVLEQTVEELEDYTPVLYTDKSSTANKPKHSTAGRKQPPPPLMETREDEDEDPLPVGVQEAETQDIINLDTSVGAENIEDLVEPDTEIVIESKAISLEDDNIDRLIQNKSDINGIILVDSLEELTPHKKPPNGDSTALMIPIQATVGSATRTASNTSTNHMAGSDSTIASMAGPTGIQQASPKEENIITMPTNLTSSTVAPPMVLVGEQDSTVHHHHHHHHEHHTTTTAAKAPTTPTTVTTTTATSSTTASISTTTMTVAPLLTTTAVDALLPNYDQASTSLKIFDIAKSVTLGCNITQEGNFELSW
uniref:Ig-like domain-containing protein n=1 Tax=Anopheles culicifacies TaxID=139723 RepID=A0A182MW75_9DIPT